MLLPHLFRSSSLLALMLGVAVTPAAASDSILLAFSRPDCSPCEAMVPVVSELIARGVPVRQVNTATEPQLAKRYAIRQTPTYVVVAEGREVTRLVGMQSIATLRRALDTTITGPITNTNASLVAPQFSGETNIQPRTRLTPLPNQFASTFEKNSPRFDSESLPNVQLADAIERARAATVRLRVFDGRGYGAGTGTIIDTHGDEALVLTCGHLFRDGTKDDKIEVDLFVAGDVITVTGQLIDFDAGDRDIGLVAIRPGVMIQPVAVIADGEKPRTGESVFSFGCDRGDDPSRHDTRVTGVNKYNQNIGASNIEIEGAPIDGRSGGGLFDQRGVLIGVCNAADYKSDVGIYTGPGSIHWQLDRVRLSHLYRNGPKGTIAQAQTSMPQSEMSLATAPIKQPVDAMTAPSSREMIVIFRDPSGSQRDEVVTLRSPDEALMRQIKTAALR